MKAPQPVPYQGSKRALAPLILNYFPNKVERLIEPFAGSAAISVASALRDKASNYWINDLNQPLVALLEEIINHPKEIAAKYEKLWREQLGHERSYYDEIRTRFNTYHRTEDFLYLLARCVKGAVRYNTQGEFNQSPDNRRKGKRPANMWKDISRMSALLKGKALFTAKDYSEIFEQATTKDLIYMDPPYQGTSKKKDSRYIAGLRLEEFIEHLAALNQKKIRYIISFDGKTGNKSYGNDLPEKLELTKIMVEVGRSTTATLLGNKATTYEALYLSESLVQQLGTDLPTTIAVKSKQLQLL